VAVLELEDVGGETWGWMVERAVLVRAHGVVARGTREFRDEANRHDRGEYLYYSNY
jgi:hypothetical protein